MKSFPGYPFFVALFSSLDVWPRLIQIWMGTVFLTPKIGMLTVMDGIILTKKCVNGFPIQWIPCTSQLHKLSSMIEYEDLTDLDLDGV